MELSSVDYEYTRDEILALRSDYANAKLPEHLFNPDYVTSHGKFSPDKFVECMWKNERPQKSVNRTIRSEAESLQNGSPLAPQRRNFQGGCKESVGAVPATARNLKTDKRPQLGTANWSFNSRGFTTNGYRNDNTRNSGVGRRDSNHTEALPEWMDDGPENSDELMHLGGFNEQEKRLEQNFQKLGLPDVISRQKEEEKLVLPASDVEFAAQFGIMDVAEIESKMIKDEVESPKSSRLSRFFGSERSQESRQTPTLPSQSEPVLPAVARLLSAGSQSIGPLSDPASVNPLSGLFKQAQSSTPPVHNRLPEQITSVTPPAPHPPNVNRFSAEPSDATTAQKSSKNIDLVPTAVMLQRTTVKEQVDVRAPRFSNPNSPSPFHEQEVGGHHPSHTNHQWQSDGFHNSNDSNLNNVPPNCIPTFCQLGIHIFPLPNPIALAADNKHIAEALKSGDFKTAGCIQTRLHAQMQVFAALQHFRNDASFVIVPATNPQFDHLLDCFIEQQRQLDSSLSEKFDDDLVECHNPLEKHDIYHNLQSRFSPSTSHSLERLMSNQSVGCAESNGSPNSLSILNKLPTNAKLLTVEELERQILGNC